MAMGMLGEMCVAVCMSWSVVKMMQRRRTEGWTCALSFGPSFLPSASRAIPGRRRHKYLCLTLQPLQSSYYIFLKNHR